MILTPRHAVTSKSCSEGLRWRFAVGPDHQLLFQAFWGPRRKGTPPMLHDRKQQRKARSAAAIEQGPRALLGLGQGQVSSQTLMT